jgi:hypothetical protein
VAETAAGYARTVAERAEAQAYGLTSDDLRDWAPFSPIEIYWALKHDVTPAAARRWAREELRVCDTVRAIALAMTPEEVRVWAGADFAPSDAVEAKEMGVLLETAVAWREAGFILPDAALLIQDGWTLEEAVNARHDGIADRSFKTGV